MPKPTKPTPEQIESDVISFVWELLEDQKTAPH